MAERRFDVSRIIIIDAPPEQVHAYVNNLRRWQEWSPWESLDPKVLRTYEGPEAGTGATYSWTGNRRAGAGSMNITSSTPERIEVDVAFLKPFPSRNSMTFAFDPFHAKTRVTWRVSGGLSPLMAVVQRVRPLDKLIGPDFDRGLMQLQREAEA